MKTKFYISLIILSILGSGTGVWFYTKPKTEEMGGKADRRMDRAIPVQALTIKPAALPLTLDALGTVEAEQSVAIRAEISGVLEKVHFREGDLVQAGQLLFQIDAGTQQAEVEKAQANLMRDQAALQEAQVQAKRLKSLAEKEFITQQEYAQAGVQEQSTSAAVRADQASLRAMQLQLAHARITSPITGRIGALNIKQGNLVSAGSVTPLVTINATQAVMISFSVPQQQLQKIRQQQHKGALKVELRRESQTTVIATGSLAFIDNTVDTQTGSIRLKARIPNKQELIWPGELLTVRLILEIQTDALLVPETAVQTGQNGTFVYVITEGKARVQTIEIARQEGTQVAVAKGLSVGQQVILNPPKNLKPDSLVELLGAPSGVPPKTEGNSAKPAAAGQTAEVRHP
jgi:multidrug efflux system membrane fusion protein